MSFRPAHTARIRIPAEYWPQLRFAMPAPLESTYDEEVLADAPTLYWPLGETHVATAIDHSGNGYHGQIAGPPATQTAAPLVPSATPGTRVSEAAGWVEGPALDLSAGGTALGCTFEAMVRTSGDAAWHVDDPVNVGVSSYRHLGLLCGIAATSHHVNSAGNHIGLALGYASNIVERPVFMLPRIGAAFVPATASFQPHAATHLAATYQASGGVGDVYVNGSSTAANVGGAGPIGSGTVYAAPALDVRLAASASSGSFPCRFVGQLGHVAVYPTALPASRIRAHAAAAQRDHGALNRGGVGFTPATCRFEGPPQRWHFPADAAPRGTDDFTVFVVVQLSYTGATQMLLHCTAQPVAASGFQLDWTTNSGFRWQEVDQAGATAVAAWSAATTAKHVLAIVHAGGLTPVFVGYADGAGKVFSAGKTWHVQNTLTLGTFVGPLSVASSAIEQVYIVRSALPAWEVARISEALA